MQDSPPSWLYMVDKGATTVWEDWEGLGPEGAPRASLNHYSKGAVISFLHTHVAGLQLLDEAPAYRKLRVAPQPGGGLSWAEVVHDSPYGRIETAWRLEGARFELVVTAPPGTTADVVLPDGRQHTAEPGWSNCACAAKALVRRHDRRRRGHVSRAAGRAS